MGVEMLDWLDKKLGPPAKILTSLKEVKKFIAENEVVVVGFFSEAGGEEAGKYNLACLDYEDYPVAITHLQEAQDHYKVGDNSVVLFKKYDEKKVVYEGDLETNKIREFIAARNLPCVVEFNHPNAQRIFKHPEVKSHLLVFHNKSSETFNDEVGMMNKVCQDYKNNVLFVTVDVGEEDHRR